MDEYYLYLNFDINRILKIIGIFFIIIIIYYFYNIALKEIF